MRVKVIYDKANLVIPVPQTNDKVFNLIQVVNSRLQSYLGDRTVRIKELCTSDGFYLNPNDSVSDVIGDGEVLVAKSYFAWMQDNLDLLEKASHTVSASDYATWPTGYYTVDIGKHKHNKIYIKVEARVSGKPVTHRLELFDEESLQSFGKDGKHLVTRYEGKSEKANWFAEIWFHVAKDTVTGIEIHLQATSDKRPEIVFFPLEVVGLTVSAPKVIQTAAFPKPAKKYELPKATREGPAFEPKQYLSSHLSPSGIPKEDLQMDGEVVSTGDSGLEIKQKDPILADQTWYSEETKGFDNLFLNHLSIFNPGSEEVAIVKITSEYEVDGKWVTAKTRCGSKSGYYNYYLQGPDPDEGFNLGSNDRYNLAIGTYIFVQAPAYEKNRRAHGSLPDPLRIKITLANKQGGKSEIITEYKNRPLYLDTKESEEGKKEGNPKAIFWTQTDDVPAEARLWASIFAIEDRLEINTSNSNRNAWLRQSDLPQYIYQATKAGKSEVPLDNCCYAGEKHGHDTQVNILVDIENQWAYGLKFEQKTNSSKATEYFLIPDW